jgi:hypothetical protein
MNLSKMIHILRNGTGFAAEFLENAEAMLATLTGDDKDQLKAALADARSRSDTLHDQVQTAADDVVRDPVKDKSK